MRGEKKAQREGRIGPAGCAHTWHDGRIPLDEKSARLESHRALCPLAEARSRCSRHSGACQHGKARTRSRQLQSGGSENLRQGKSTFEIQYSCPRAVVNRRHRWCVLLHATRQQVMQITRNTQSDSTITTTVNQTGVWAYHRARTQAGIRVCAHRACAGRMSW